MPGDQIENAVAYEDWIAEVDGNFKWAEFDENTAAGLCYDLGTGDPKGVLYSHRSNVLHALQACMKDTLSVSAQDSILPIVPMFHANAWSLAFSVPLAGAKVRHARPSSTALRCTNCWNRKASPSPGGRADRMADADAAYAVEQPQAYDLAARRDRRFGLPALDDRIFRGARRHRLSRLGHDRDEPDRHDRRDRRNLAISAARTFWRSSRSRVIRIFAVEMKITDDEDNQLPWDGVKFAASR